jgi:hypothetical protein
LADVRSLILLIGLAAAACSPAAVLGHEIPSDVTVQIIVKPQGRVLQLLVRAPLEAMQDIEFPTFGPGYLDLERADAGLRDAALLWLANDIEIYEGERRLPRPTLVAARASIPSDRSFATYDAAIAHIRAPPLAGSTQLPWQQALLDVLFEVPIESERSLFAIRPSLDRLGLRVVNAVRFAAPDGGMRLFQIEGDQGLVPLDPRWHQSSLRFLRQGFDHILDGVDHLLFLLCLVVPFRRNMRGLVWVVTAFTLGHSVTLIASAQGMAPNALWFPPMIETLIAASIFYMALENIVAVNAEGRPGGGSGAGWTESSWVRSRWAMAFGFGLIHGFGFSFALSNTLQFAGDHVLTSLLAFNVGIELGQLLVLLLLIPVLNLLFRHVVDARIGVIVLSVIVAHTAWHWMTERFSIWRQYDVSWTAFRDAVDESGLPWILSALAIGVLAWLARRQLRRRVPVAKR